METKFTLRNIKRWHILLTLAGSVLSLIFFATGSGINSVWPLIGAGSFAYLVPAEWVKERWQELCFLRDELFVPQTIQATPLLEEEHVAMYPVQMLAALPPLVPLVEEEEEPELFIEDDSEEEDELDTPRTGVFQFSEVLEHFTPTLDKIYLATLLDGTKVFTSVKGLCHVALAGSTGGGKSSIMRLLMAQLCKAGARVILLDPHFTRYDIDAIGPNGKPCSEDWTPYEPYLKWPPMECRKFEIIEHFLYKAAKQLLPERLEKRAQSQPWGKPYVIILDELPLIVKNIPEAPAYIDDILKEGRKVGIILICSAQDFQVKTIGPNQGGAVRDCYRTALYVGGDVTTARVLLDIQKGDKPVPESALGKGVVMIRNGAVKKAQLAHVPYVDNEALYQLLGPSTYNPDQLEEEDEIALDLPDTQSTLSLPTPEAVEEIRERKQESNKYIEAWFELQRVGKATVRNFAQEMGIGQTKAYTVLDTLSKQRLIEWNRRG